MNKHRKTHKVMCGDVAIGGTAPISIQSMCNVDTRDSRACVEQIKRLSEAGCEIIRLAVPDSEAADALGVTIRELRKNGLTIPVVADIHFDYRLALAAIKNGADKIRINPGNIGDTDRVRAVVDAAKERHIPIRIGVNGGSLEKDILAREGGVTARGLAESALRNAKLVEDMDFGDIVISMKSSDVRMNFEACRLVSENTNHPLHIGVTEAGTLSMGKIKSAAGIGALLLCGIGDTMRVSLTADPIEEIYAAKAILKSIGLRKTGIDLVSCPTCGRTRVDLVRIARDVERALAPFDEMLAAAGKSLKVAVMGCAVNGPGEAKEADLGVAGGDGKGLIFAKGEIIKAVSEDKITEELTEMVKKRILKDTN